MFYEFDKEIDVLNKCNINDKLEILYVYTEFYNEIISAIPLDSKNFLDRIGNYNLLEKTKKSLKERFISNTWRQIVKKTDLKTFFSDYLKKFNDVSNFSPVGKIINNYKYIGIFGMFSNQYKQDRMKHIIKTLEKIDMDFNTKAYIMLYLKNYIEHITKTYNIIYRGLPDKTLKIHNFIYNIIEELPNIIKISNGHEEFQYNLMMKTYSLIVDKYNSEDCIKENVYNTFNNVVLENFIKMTLNDYKEYYPQIIFEYLSGYIDDTTKEKGLSSRQKQRIRNKLNNKGLSSKI